MKAKRRRKPKNKPDPNCCGLRVRGGLTTAVVIGCTHEPYLDERLWDAFCDFCKCLKPDAIVRNGDIFDFYQISRFMHDPAREGQMATDREVFWGHEMQLQKALKGVTLELIALKGNHEDRVQRYLIKNPDVRSCLKNFGISAPTWESFLGLDKLGYDCHDSAGVTLPRLSLGDIDVWHGKSFAKYAVTHNLMRMGNNYCNHTHRMSAWYRKVGGEVLYGYEGGHMADPRLAHDYIEDEEDWQQGFGVIHFEQATGYFEVDLIPVKQVGLRKRFCYCGDYWEWTV